MVDHSVGIAISENFRDIFKKIDWFEDRSVPWGKTFGRLDVLVNTRFINWLHHLSIFYSGDEKCVRPLTKDQHEERTSSLRIGGDFVRKVKNWCPLRDCRLLRILMKRGIGLQTSWIKQSIQILWLQMKATEKKRLYYKLLVGQTLPNWQVYNNASLVHEKLYNTLETWDGMRNLYRLVKRGHECVLDIEHLCCVNDKSGTYRLTNGDGQIERVQRKKLLILHLHTHSRHFKMSASVQPRM